MHRATKCPCGRCKDWHVEPLAAVQGVGFTQQQAEAVADLLNKMAKREATEDQIEARAERMMDHLDRLLLGGQIDQHTYDLAVQDLDRWATKERLDFPFLEA